MFSFDRTLGGFEMELRLRDHLAKIFNEQKKSKKDVTENSRAMAKLLKEAQRLKTVLSANAEHVAQVRRGCALRDTHARTLTVYCIINKEKSLKFYSLKL